MRILSITVAASRSGFADRTTETVSVIQRVEGMSRIMRCRNFVCEGSHISAPRLFHPQERSAPGVSRKGVCRAARRTARRSFLSPALPSPAAVS